MGCRWGALQQELEACVSRRTPLGPLLVDMKEITVFRARSRLSYIGLCDAYQRRLPS